MLLVEVCEADCLISHFAWIFLFLPARSDTATDVDEILTMFASLWGAGSVHVANSAAKMACPIHSRKMTSMPVV